MKRAILILNIVLIFTTCKKKNNSVSSELPTTSFVAGVLKDKTGFDGCGWVIELYSVDQFGNKFLEPINLKSFNIPLIDGLLVNFVYTPKTDIASVCMLGAIVELTVILKR